MLPSLLASARRRHLLDLRLATHTLDPDLRLKVLEVSDALDRTVMIRQKYPD